MAADQHLSMPREGMLLCVHLSVADPHFHLMRKAHQPCSAVASALCNCYRLSDPHLTESLHVLEGYVQSPSAAQVIWKGLRDLNAILPPGSEGRALVEAESAELGQPYVLKRLFAEGGIGLAFTSFPTALLEVSGVLQLAHECMHLC